jgi:hypothetical protein
MDNTLASPSEIASKLSKILDILALRLTSFSHLT